jgi:hypothetical protein
MNLPTTVDSFVLSFGITHCNRCFAAKPNGSVKEFPLFDDNFPPETKGLNSYPD